MKARIILLAVLPLAACSPKRIHEEPIMKNGERVQPADDVVEAARVQAARDINASVKARDSVAAGALAQCAPAVCQAIARGEVAIGMSEAQVLAATRTTEAAWAIRDAGDASVMVPASPANAPRDAVGEIALLQLSNGVVTSYSYREAQGVRVVATPVDATTAGRATALADMLLREGDDLVARGDFNGALNRYDRAQVLRANDPQIDYRIATVLDKQLRPIEALIRYQLFLHKLELEKIKAQGEAYAQLATAIAYAKERIVVLEKHR
jgi:tetratricopeptide (TPR) repeat protein